MSRQKMTLSVAIGQAAPGWVERPGAPAAADEMELASSP